ncbi:MAG: penicillin-binding transpeptidase domain-containing protein [Lachnospiraceae bacterium]|nr:penicillin-binding transpeptidase domain-containing protein [Lachnospiraceae bacterium]
MPERETARNKTHNRHKIVIVFFLCTIVFLLLAGRLGYLMIISSEHYTERAKSLHERERSIKAARGRIIDAKGTVIADNKTVCTISVIHNQITDPEGVIAALSRELGLSEDFVRRRVEKYTSIERIRSNVDKTIGDRIRDLGLDGVKVDDDYKRYYPYGSLASKVLGFTGGDNQGIIGLEVKYEEYLMGIPGTILTVTDAKGVEISTQGEERIEPVSGSDLHLSLDINIQSYATQLAMQVMENKEAEGVSIIVMNPSNGEIIAMVDAPEFDLNAPFSLPLEYQEADLTSEETQNVLNGIWRNSCINDTYEPGSAFKIMTAAAGLSGGVLSLSDTFSCPGYIMVEDRRMRCHKPGGHGGQDFTEATKNSCNPAFVTVGLRLGVDNFYHYFEKFGLLKKTGIDLPGEANTIMHKKENMKAVELATVSFGQSFQVTPIQMAVTVASLVNGGNRITPHFAVKSVGQEGEEIFMYPYTEDIISDEVGGILREILEETVADGTGRNAYVEGWHVAGKTATSQTLPRGSGKYIASFVAFAPAYDPQILALVIINNPQGVYYGGQVAAPVVKHLFENILPYALEKP